LAAIGRLLDPVHCPLCATYSPIRLRQRIAEIEPEPTVEKMKAAIHSKRGKIEAAIQHAK
jgi:hypothetical protein